MCEEFEKGKKYIGNLKKRDSCSFGWSRHTLYIFESVFVFVFNLYLYDKDYLVFVCSRELARILHLLFVRRPLPRVGGNSQFSNLIPEKKLESMFQGEMASKSGKRRRKSFEASFQPSVVSQTHSRR